MFIIPNAIGSLRKAQDAAKHTRGFYTFFDPNTGDEYVLSELTLSQYGGEIDEQWIRSHVKKRSYTGVE